VVVFRLMPLPRSLSRPPLAAAISGVLLVACAAAGSPVVRNSSLPGSGPLALATPDPPNITVTPTDGTSGVRLDAQVVVNTNGGTLDTVIVHTAGDPTPLGGVLSNKGRTWTLRTPLAPDTAYTVEASAQRVTGDAATALAKFATIPTPTRLITDPFPGDGATVGVGMPVILRFHSPIAADKQATVIDHLQVQSTPQQEGAWHWVSDREVHYRPKDFWQAGTKVQLNANLTDLDVGNNVWGLAGWSETFNIGEKHVSVIDLNTHMMQVSQSDNVIRTYPISGGRPEFPTLGGTLFVWYKLQKVRMVSTTVGIPVNAPGGYDGDVLWDTAISTNGFYTHMADWNVPQHGHANVSHGCVNMNPADAQEFWNFSLIGDVVQVLNSPRPADYGDGEGDWQIPFDQYPNTAVAAPPASAPSSNVGGGL
jgi:lipoprotein-anchoring transpeptidase ErfK/SrfK